MSPAFDFAVFCCDLTSFADFSCARLTESSDALLSSSSSPHSSSESFSSAKFSNPFPAFVLLLPFSDVLVCLTFSFLPPDLLDFTFFKASYNHTVAK